MLAQGMTRARVIVLFLVLASLVGCSVNPVTGKQELSFVSESWELDTGQQQYLPLRQAQGGDYVVDPRVERYVNEVGQKIAAVSDRKLPYEFNVINSSVPNAWALPGGKIAINRGLLTELNSEAELAAVLGHEIIHAAARHSAQGAERNMLLQSALLATGIAVQGEDYAQLIQMGAGLGSQLINTKYGRDAEREADYYGIEYMVRAGYDPQGAVNLQQTFVDMAEQNQSSWFAGLFASHPASRERLESNRKLAAQYPAGGKLGRETYQQMMAYLKDKEPAYDNYQLAQQAVQEKQYAKAQQLTKKAIAKEPKEGHFYSLAGDIEYANKNLGAAVQQYDKAISLNDEFFYYFMRRGLAAKQLDRYSQAEGDFKRANALLPTAVAYNGLGDIARLQGNETLAKEYYAKVATDRSSAGQAAYASLVKLDMPSNPTAYIKVANRVDAQGRWLITISNPTPVAIESLVLRVRYPDSRGIAREENQQVRQLIKSGQTAQLATGLYVDQRYVGSYGSRLMSVELAE